MKKTIAIWAGAAIVVEPALAQQLVPATISNAAKAESNIVTLWWPTIPGRTYDIQTRDGIEAPWVGTNVAPIRARTTVGSLPFDAMDSDAPVRFFQVREQAGPAANNSAFTAAT